jgi:hypothetical protein
VNHLRTLAAVAFAPLVIAVAGCAQERDPINHVQTNALAKSFFVGADLSNPSDDPEFYTTVTVVDVPYGVTTGMFTGATGSLKRIKWEITEKVLSARLTYETIDGVDGQGSRTTNNGQVIAAFDIQKHFDIKHAYNSSTGEELNVVDENDSDRPWYQREYMRVDWSSNKIVSAYTFDPLAGLRDPSSDGFEALTYRVDDPADPDAMVFEPDQGYFDITNKVYVKSSTIQGMPSCFYYGGFVVGGTYPYGTCDPSEVKVRTSFLRIAHPGEAGDRDYELRDWDGARANAHGAFTQERLGYDRKYGIVDSRWHRFIQRYNIWQKSHTDVTCGTTAGADSHFDGDRDGTEDECQSAGAGSRCDEYAQRCTIPYAQRQIRPNAWHYNLNGQDELIFRSSQEAADEWDTALRMAVQAVRRVECLRTNAASLGGTPWAGETDCNAIFPVSQEDEAEGKAVKAVNECHRQNGYDSADCLANVDPHSVAAMPAMIALCHSPVAHGDDPMCGPEGLATRPGDLRYHQVNVVPSPQSASPWGYGPSNADPLTGEVIQASINVWNSVTDQTAQLMVDQIRWINGELPTSAITSGNYVQGWVGAATAHQGGKTGLLTNEEIDKRILGSGDVTPEDLAHAREHRRTIDMSKAPSFRISPLVGTSGPASAIQGTGGRAQADAEARKKLFKGTPAEIELTGPMWLEMAGLDKDAPLDETTLDRASPLRGLDVDRTLGIEKQVNSALASKGQCMLMAPEPTGVVSLAGIMKNKFPYDPNAPAAVQSERVNKMWNYLRGKLNYAVIAHEMGHTVGMMHNFASSWDKFNYRPQYWQLRTKGGTVNTQCTGPVDDGSTCIGPRYFDPLDKDEAEQMIWMWSQTSVMDYAGDMTQDTLGLGVYDYATARSFYADVVDVRADGVTVADAEGREQLGIVDTASFPFADMVQNANGDYMHYSQWNDFFHLIRNCRAVDDSAPANWNQKAQEDPQYDQGNWDPVFDGHVVRHEKCDRIPVEYVDWRDMVADIDQASVNYDPRWKISRRARDTQDRPRIPYAFANDYVVEGGLPSAYQHDNGADIYEEITFHDSLYEDRHIFDNFRRGRVNFSLFGAFQRSVSRYHSKISGLALTYAFYHDVYMHDVAKYYKEPLSKAIADYEGPGGPFREYAIATSLSFDHFTRVLTRPQPGPHSFGELDSIHRPLDGAIQGQVGAHTVDIPQGSSGVASDVSYGGRSLQNGYVAADGYWNINQLGSYYEKTHAIFDILGTGSWYGNNLRLEGIDGRWLVTSLVNMYPEGIRRLLGTLLTEDQELFAPQVASRADGLPDVNGVGDTIYPKHPIGWVSFVPPNGPQVCWPTSGRQVCSDSSGNPVAAPGQPVPIKGVPIDPELGYEVQKWIIAYAYFYLPANQKMDWVDMMRIYKTGLGYTPNFTEVVVFKDPTTGLGYLAKRYGNETLFGKTYDKGIAAKVLQWANQLAAKAYLPADPAALFDPNTGEFKYLTDASGNPSVAPDPALAPADPANVQCEENRWCMQLRNYRGFIDFMREASMFAGFPPLDYNGIYSP